MVMTEWMKEVKKALETIPKGTPNRLENAMKKAKLTYEKDEKGPSSSHHASAASHGMKKSHKRRRGRSGKGRKGKSMRKSHRSRKHHRGGAMPKLSPSNYEGGQNVGTSGPGVQMRAAMSST
jgi:hypothetical protein